jgi:hypothetical protein
MNANADSALLHAPLAASTEQIRCTACGALDTGRFCSNCGFELQPGNTATYRSFAETFLKLSARKRYLVTYFHLLRSPTKNTLALAEHVDPRLAFAFLEVGAFVYALTALSRVLSFRSGIVGALVTPVSFALTWSISLSATYWLARRKSPRNRSSREYLTLASLYLGFSLPATGIAEFLQIVRPTLGLVVFLVLLGPISIYTIRLWKRFWGLSGRRVFGYLFAGSLLGGVADLILLGSVKALGG